MTNEELFSKSRSEWEHLIDEYVIGKNAERDRKILKRRLLDGVTLEPLAEEFDLSVQRIKTIIYNSQSKIMKHI
jgi:DNA-directed RNA polymerase sigma subunit (sigma70/sigma32)